MGYNPSTERQLTPKKEMKEQTSQKKECQVRKTLGFRIGKVEVTSLFTL